MTTCHGKDRGPWALIWSCVFRALLFAALWWVLVDGDQASWPVGAVVIAVATVVSMLMTGGQGTTPSQFGARWGRWLMFLPYFGWKSVLGAVDVAWRAYAPRLPLTPAFYDYPVRLSTERAQVFFANVVSVLPGTLSAELRQQQLVVHALDSTRPILRDLAALEEKIAPLFGQDLMTSEPRP